MMIRWALAMGVAAVVGCGDPTNTTGTLVMTDGGATDSGGNGGNACNDSCAAQARASCSAFQMGMCVSTCQAQYAAYPSCAAQLDAAMRCSAGATYTCSATSNRPLLMSSCIAELVAALQCAAPDAGSSR